MLVIAGYLATVVVCVTMKSVLITNPNRGGFLALAQLPVVFLFATKNSILSLLLGPGNGYEKLNYIHRWSGRGMFLAATVHGALWIRNHLQYGLPILGQQKETSGVAAFSLLCILVLTSLRPVRRLLYQAFWIVQYVLLWHILCYLNSADIQFSVLGFVAFFVTIRYHTIYAVPWLYPPLAFYGLDLVLRLLRYRIKDASLVPIDQNMTLVSTLRPFALPMPTYLVTRVDPHSRLRLRLDCRPAHPFARLLQRSGVRIPSAHDRQCAPCYFMHALPHSHARC